MAKKKKSTVTFITYQSDHEMNETIITTPALEKKMLKEYFGGPQSYRWVSADEENVPKKYRVPQEEETPDDAVVFFREEHQGMALFVESRMKIS